MYTIYIYTYTYIYICITIDHILYYTLYIHILTLYSLPCCNCSWKISTNNLKTDNKMKNVKNIHWINQKKIKRPKSRLKEISNVTK